MFRNPSLTARVAAGKLSGLAIGAIGFVSLWAFWPEIDPLARWGFLLWYLTMGAFIGLAGVFVCHPVLRVAMPWWVAAPLIGAWMNFVLTLLAYDMLAAAMEAVFGAPGGSPFWFALEGAAVGAVIGWFATRFGGEGEALFEDRRVS